MLYPSKCVCLGLVCSSLNIWVIAIFFIISIFVHRVIFHLSGYFLRKKFPAVQVCMSKSPPILENFAKNYQLTLSVRPPLQHYHLWGSAEPPSDRTLEQRLWLLFAIFWSCSFIHSFNSHWTPAVYQEWLCVWWKQKWIWHISAAQRAHYLEEKAGNGSAWFVWVEVEPGAMISCVCHCPMSITELVALVETSAVLLSLSRFPFPNPSIPGFSTHVSSFPRIPLLSPSQCRLGPCIHAAEVSGLLSP